jgi:hypothetical protein
MPAFVERYSAEMREALFRAVFDREISVRRALRTAAAGQLEDLTRADQATLGEMTYAYACELVRLERARRGAVDKLRQDASEVAKQLAARLLALADREVTRIECTKLKTPVDAGQAIAAAKMAREALALTRDATSEPKTSAKAPEHKDRGKQPPRTLAATIASTHEPEASNDDDSQDVGGDSAAPRAQEETNETNEQDDSSVRSRAA